MMQSMKKRPDKKSTTEEARPRGGPARNIADIVPNIGRAAFRRFGFVQSSIVTRWGDIVRSEEHTSELQSLMRISYAVFCLKKKTTTNYNTRAPPIAHVALTLH